MQSFIKLLYSLLIAVAIALFAGLAIDTFYPAPKAPDYPTNYGVSGSEQTQKSYDAAYKAYQAKDKEHMKNVTFIVIPIAVLAFVIGLYVLDSSTVIGEGVALGGVLTSIYAVITSSIADQRSLRLLSVTVLLVGVVLLARQKFATAPAKAIKKKS